MVWPDRKGAFSRELPYGDIWFVGISRWTLRPWIRTHPTSQTPSCETLVPSTDDAEVKDELAGSGDL